MITDPKELAEQARKSLAAEPHPAFGLVDHLEASRDAGDALAEIALRAWSVQDDPASGTTPEFVMSALVNGLLETLNHRRPAWMGYGIEYPQ
jgi:hypothetical protein